MLNVLVVFGFETCEPAKATGSRLPRKSKTLDFQFHSPSLLHCSGVTVYSVGLVTKSEQDHIGIVSAQTYFVPVG